MNKVITLALAAAAAVGSTIAFATDEGAKIATPEGLIKPVVQEIQIDERFKGLSEVFGTLFDTYPESRVTPAGYVAYNLKASCGVTNWYNAYYTVENIFIKRQRSWYISQNDTYGSWMEIDMKERGTFRLDCSYQTKTLTITHVN